MSDRVPSARAVLNHGLRFILASWAAIARCGIGLAVVSLTFLASLASAEPRADYPAQSGDIGAIRQAAEAGDAAAQKRLGDLYARGLVVPSDGWEAVAWYRRSAKQGYGPAQLALAVVLEEGYRASDEQRLRAEQELKASPMPTGERFQELMKIIGVMQDPSEAARWYAKAAQQGMAEAANNLGTLYRLGRGVAADLSNAARWYDSAARAGDVEAQANLGSLYELGLGVPLDRVAATQWYETAAVNGHARAIMGLARTRGPDRWLEEQQSRRRIIDSALKERPGGSARIVLEAIAPVFVDIRDDKGARIFNGSLSKGQEYPVPARDDLFLYAYRARDLSQTLAALRIRVDGREVNPGAVRGSFLLLDPARLERQPLWISERRWTIGDGLAGFPRKSGRVTIRARQDSTVDLYGPGWLVGFPEVRISTGETVAVPDDVGLIVDAYADADVEILVDGRAVMTLSGKPGHVVRIPLEPRSLQDHAVVPEHVALDNETVEGVIHTGIRGNYLFAAWRQDAAGRPSAAAPIYEILRRKTLHAVGPNGLEYADVLQHIAKNRAALGRPDEAQDLLDAVLASREGLGLIHDEGYLSMLLASARLRFRRGHLQLAEEQAQLALALLETSQNQANVALMHSPVSLLADLYVERRHHARALTYLERRILLREHSAREWWNGVGAQELLTLARTLTVLGRRDDAGPILRRAHLRAKADVGARDLPEPLQHPLNLSFVEGAFGPSATSALAARSLGTLAAVYAALGRSDEAQPLETRALGILETALGADHEEVAVKLRDIAALDMTRGRYANALDRLRRATAIFVESKDDERPEIGRNRLDTFSLYLEAIEGVSGGLPETDLLAESFMVAQLSRASRAGRAIGKMAARLAAGDGVLAKLLRDREDTVREIRRLMDEIGHAAALPPAARDLTEEQRLRARADSVRRARSAIEARLNSASPGWVYLGQSGPMPLAAIQGVLTPHEALVMWSIGDSASYVWGVRGDRVVMRRLALDGHSLEAHVRALRSTLDVASVGTVTLPAFPIREAHELYRLLLGPIDDLLTGAAHVVLVPDGALQSLPLTVLVTEFDERVTGDYRRVAWLGVRQALTILPSVSALERLRRTARADRAPDPFVGFGDPLFSPGHPGTRGSAPMALYTSRGAANVAAIRALPALPETAHEIRTIGLTLGAGPADFSLGAAATERQVKSTSLERFRVLAFSTHAVMAGEFDGVAEPALVLTPPSNPSDEDDGLLTASEVASLQLNADWVILAACNTAAGDGTPGAEGLSGLAAAFFYAGTRALLVSHWAVASEPTVALLTAVFDALAGAPDIGRAEALRRAMQKLLHHGSQTKFSHPMFWAPFVVVGEGANS